MTNLKYSVLLFLIAVFVSCQQESGLPGLPVLPENGQTISLLGDTLYTPSILLDDFDEMNRQLDETLADYRSDPDNADTILWLGRRAAALGEYRNAIGMFSEGIGKHPEDARMYRHRGHRYLNLRQFGLAIDDFEKAEELMDGAADEPEPDLFPNPAGIPTSTLKSNVWYHLGLARYLQGDFGQASEQFQKVLDLGLTSDMETSAIYWHYMALKRSGKDLEAGLILDRVSEDTNLLEGEVYLNLLLVFKGVFDADYLMESSPEAMQNATFAYGIGNWHYMNGRQDRAAAIWEELHNGNQGQWPAFGYIAAEAELERGM